jgi:hypothetical protein
MVKRKFRRTAGEDLIPPRDSARRRQAMPPRAFLHSELPPPLTSCSPAAPRALAASWPPVVIRRTTPRAPATWPPADLPCREQMPPPGLLLTRREEASIHDTLKGNTVKRDGGAGGAARS